MAGVIYSAIKLIRPGYQVEAWSTRRPSIVLCRARLVWQKVIVMHLPRLHHVINIVWDIAKVSRGVENVPVRRNARARECPSRELFMRMKRLCVPRWISHRHDSTFTTCGRVYCDCIQHQRKMAWVFLCIYKCSRIDPRGTICHYWSGLERVSRGLYNVPARSCLCG